MSIEQISKEQLDELLSIFEENNIKRQLDFIYDRLPDNKCDQCADCCFASTQVHFGEFLNLYSFVQSLPEETQKEIAKRAVRYEMLNVVTLDHKCPFLDGKDCLVHEVLPLHCRFFGMYPEHEYDDLREKSKKQNTSVAIHYARNHRLLLSEEVMTYDVDQCNHNVDEKGNRTLLTQRERDLYYNMFVSLHNRYLPDDTLTADEDELNNFTYLYLVTYFPSEQLEEIRVEIAKEFLEKGTMKRLDALLKEHDFDFGMAKVRSIDSAS